MKPEITTSALNDLWEALVTKNGTCWAKVVSRSMYPTIKIGDQVLVEKVRPDEVRFGDIIVFRQNRRLVIHRVIGKSEHGGQFHFLEKGDANLQSSLVSAEDIIGKVIIIRSQARTLNTTSGVGRLLQLILACISYSSVYLRRIFKGRFVREKPVFYYSTMYNDFFLLLQRITLRLFR